VRHRFLAIPIALAVMLITPFMGVDRSEAQTPTPTPSSVFHFTYIDESIVNGTPTLRVHVIGPNNGPGAPLTLIRFAPSGTTFIPFPTGAQATYTEPNLEARICYRVLAATIPPTQSDVLCYLALPNRVLNATWTLQPIGSTFTNVTPFQLNNTNPTQTSAIRFRARFSGGSGVPDIVVLPEFACSTMQCTWDRNASPTLLPVSPLSCYVGYTATATTNTDALCIFHSGDGFPVP
jgi:hypothetical protein